MKSVKLIFFYICLFSAGSIASVSFLYLKANNYPLDTSSIRLLLAKAPKFYIVVSGSMEPTLKVGSVVIVLPKDEYYPDDIVSFKIGEKENNTVTHRILARNYLNGIHRPPIYLTKGDANKSFDPGKLEEKQIIGKSLFSIPYLGYLVNYFKKPYGFILFVIIPATIIIYEEILRIKREIASLFKKKQTNEIINY